MALLLLVPILQISILQEQLNTQLIQLTQALHIPTGSHSAGRRDIRLINI